MRTSKKEICRRCLKRNDELLMMQRVTKKLLWAKELLLSLFIVRKTCKCMLN